MLRIKQALGSAAVVAAGFVSTANAALPTEIGTGLTAVETDALALVALVWPIVLTIFGATVVFKLFKRYANKI